MKIGLVLEAFDPQRGGLEQWTLQFARELTGRGYAVHVIAFKFHPAATDLCRGAVIHRVGDRSRSRLARAAALEAHLRTLDLDVVHDMGCGWYADIFHPHGGSTVALWEHNLMRIPRWRQIRFWRERRYRENAEIERRQLGSQRACIVAVSRMVQGHFATYHSLPSERTTLIYNGVDLDRFSPIRRPAHRETARRKLGLDAGEVLFLLLAHNLLLKNALTLIRAVAHLKAIGCLPRVVIAGGRKPEQFARLVDSLNLSALISFIEAVDDPVPLFAAADVYVHPTWYDPCSLVTLEAWASGLPVITTRYNGAAELMENGQEGFVLQKPDDTSALASAMQELLSDAGLRIDMGQAARRLASSHSFVHQTDRFVTLYHKVTRANATSQS